MRDMSSCTGGGAKTPANDLDPKVALEILRAIGELSFGSVEIVVHDRKVVQIERKEKFRFASEGATGRK